MKIFVFINKFLVGLIILFLSLGIYDIYLLRNWLETRFLDKFKIVFVLKDDIQQEVVLQNIKKSCNLLKIKEIIYLDKNQIYEMVAKNEEMKTLLSVIKTNPFRDVIIVKFENYIEEELKKFFNLKNDIPEIKEVIYDYNIRSYLSRINEIKFIFDKMIIGLMVVLVLTVILKVVLFGKSELSFLIILLFSIIYGLVVIYNAKFMNNFFFDIIRLDRLNIIVHFLIYIFCSAYIFEDGVEKEKKNNLEIEPQQEI